MALTGFRDDEFLTTCKELEYPQVDGWELFVETHGVTIYRLYNECTTAVRIVDESGQYGRKKNQALAQWTSGLYEYKIYGVLDDVLPEVCAAVYMDIPYRLQWDTYAKELYETEADGKKLIYWQVNFPFPLWNRDYVYRRELQTLEHNGKKMWIVLARSDTASTLPERSGVVRVDDYIQSAVLTTDGKVGTKAYMRYYDNPRGNIPTWLINWAAKTGVPQFLTIMQKACRGYPDYLAKKAAS